MAIDKLKDNVLFGVNTGIIDANFETLNADKLEASQVLTKTNVTAFVPTQPYHPSTKQYSDSLRINWDNTYDPNDVAANVFDRDNHIGTQAPNTINTDATNRFITDSERISWNAKENAIGTKKTAFNADYGTTAGTTATGDHTHTKAEINLGNVDDISSVNMPISGPQQDEFDLKANAADLTEVDNTSDLDKPISGDTQDALDLKQNISDIPASRTSFYLDTDELESTRTTVVVTAGVRYDVVGIFIAHKLVNFTFTDNIFTYIGPGGNLDFILSGSQKSDTINLTSHYVLLHKPVGDQEEDPWIERAMSKEGAYLSTALQAVTIPPCLDDISVVTGDRFKLATFANKSSVDIIVTHLAGKFVQYD